MKHKTYLVTIEDDKAYTTEDVRNALDLYAGIDPECLTVRDITATHAARERVIQRAIEVQRWHASKKTWERLNALALMLDAAEELLALESGAKEQS